MASPDTSVPWQGWGLSLGTTWDMLYVPPLPSWPDPLHWSATLGSGSKSCSVTSVFHHPPSQRKMRSMDVPCTDLSTCLLPEHMCSCLKSFILRPGPGCSVISFITESLVWALFRETNHGQELQGLGSQHKLCLILRFLTYGNPVKE